MSTVMSTGIHKGKDSQEVATQAVKKAFGKLGNHKVDFSLVYASTAYDYQTVIDTVRKLTNNAPLIGCSSGGEFTEDAVFNQSVCVTLISSDQMKFYSAHATGISGDENKVLHTLVSKFPQEKNSSFPYRTAIILLDGLAGKGEEIAVAATNALGVDIKLVGGAAGDDLKFKQTYVFCDDAVIPDGVSVCLIESKAPLYTGVKHGHVVLSEGLTITKAKGNILYEINNQPAWDVWKKYTVDDAKQNLGMEVSQLKDPTSQGKLLLCYELGIALEGGEYKIRVPLGVNDDGSLKFACTIPQGISFNIMKSIKENQTDSARKAAGIAKLESGSVELAGALIFDCVCRGLILGDDFHKAVDEFKTVLGPIPLMGFETYGEVCYVTGEFSGFHNTTSVVLLLPKN